MVKMFLQVIVKILCLLLASGNIQAICNDGEERDPQAPACLDDCAGRRFFLGRDGICKMCVQCEPGYEHDKDCGNGENGDAVCIPCPEDHYSYNLYDCVACRVCENTKITQGCSPSTDRQCGECLPGFYKDPQNPDLCNQRCEWHSNPDTIPSCQAWLANQQGTTLSAVTSQTSSFPDVKDKGTGVTGHGSLTLIIIILLVLVLIGGSAIPVYLCCKHCRHEDYKSKDIETCTGHSREHLELVDVHTEQCRNSESATLNGDVAACGMNEIGIARPMAESGHDEGDCRSDERQTLLPGATFNSTKSNLITQDEHEHMPTGLDSEGAKISGGGTGDDEQIDDKEETVENQRLLPDANSRGTESIVSIQDQYGHMPTGLDAEEAKASEAGPNDKENDGKKEADEHQILLPDAQDEDHDGVAPDGGNGEYRGSAEAERSPPAKRKEKKGPSRTKPEQPSAKRGKKERKPKSIRIAYVKNLVMGGQYHCCNSAEHLPQGDSMYLHEECEDYDDDNDSEIDEDDADEDDEDDEDDE